MTNKTGKIIAYLRASTNKQDVDSQKLSVLEYGRKHNINIDEFIIITISSRRTTKQRRIDELLEKLNSGDTLIATELSRLGRSTAEVIGLINQLLKKDVRVVLIKQNLDMSGDKQDMASKVMVTLFSLFAELERDLISMRTKEGLAAKKAQGVKLGKPKGTIQKSIYDKDVDNIKYWLEHGMSVRQISKNLKYGSYVSLRTYVNKRGLRGNKKHIM